MTKYHSEWQPGEIIPGLEVPDEFGRMPGGRLPQEGELHNASALPMSEMALAVLLADAAMAMAMVACAVEDCEGCNLHRLVWWDTCNALSRDLRVELQAWLASRDIPLPEGPWVEVEG